MSLTDVEAKRLADLEAQDVKTDAETVVLADLVAKRDA
jgi:hypothetical protein